MNDNNAMNRFLFIFGFETPELVNQNAKWNDDFESSEAVFINAKSKHDALEWGRRIANEFFGRMKFNSDSVIDVDDYAHWISEDPKSEYDAHVINQLPRVDAGSEGQITPVVDVWLIQHCGE
ncbi:MAG: hypothetical protein GY880_24730 [Planctomycetaceae bacterium]|nr:hypothetical protein [Planctomycetaceae bacterium]